MGDYYIAKSEGIPIYISIIAMNNTYETSLYKGNKLLRRHSLQRGHHTLEKDGIKLRIQIKLFKTIPELTVSANPLNITKITRKELSNRLEELGICNELNPKKLPKEPYNIKRLVWPVIVILISMIWHITIRDKRNHWQIPSSLAMIVAYGYIFSPLIENMPKRHLDDKTKNYLYIIVGIIFMVLTQTTVDKIIKY